MSDPIKELPCDESPPDLEWDADNCGNLSVIVRLLSQGRDDVGQIEIRSTMFRVTFRRRRSYSRVVRGSA